MLEYAPSRDISKYGPSTGHCSGIAAESYMIIMAKNVSERDLLFLVEIANSRPDYSDEPSWGASKRRGVRSLPSVVSVWCLFFPPVVVGGRSIGRSARSARSAADG